MYPLRRSCVLSDVVRVSVSLSVLAGAAGLGGCAGAGAERVYGYQASTAESASYDVSGRSSSMSRLRQEAIIAQAIVAHEMRRP